VKCPKCQAANPDDAKFCIECGGPLEFRCPKCGATTPARGRFCKECGYALREAKPAPPVDYSQPQTYTPKFLADKILSAGKSLEGERKLVTVLFADVVGYTTISEKLDPEEVRQIMDGCFKILMDEVHKYEGTVDKFTGDGMMALFGAPMAHEDHAQRACYAALAIQRALEAYGDKVKRESKVDFKMRVGLNSGPVIVGAVGSDLRMDYTAVGDTVNLASRMQTMAEPGRILVSGEVHKMTRDFFRFESLGKLAVKGKGEPVEAYELLEATEVATRIEASIVRGLTRFVGRDKEMAILREAFEKAKAGSGQVVGIVGEAGVGKSRLLLELRRSLGSQDHTYLEGHCLHYGGTMAYLPVLDILRSYFDIQEGDREFLIRKRLEEKTVIVDPKLKSVLPPLQDLLSFKVEDEAYPKLEPQKKRERIFEAIRDLLIRESQGKPVILAIEDLHWMDKTSEEFLNYFIGFLANARILVILLYRPEYTHQWASRSCYSQIRVDQLPLATSAELVRSILEEGEVAPDLRDLILNRAAGNPLFMEEFTHTLLENGSIGKKDHQYVLTRKASEIQVPDTIQGIIAARIDRLDENLKRTMQVASVIGRDFAYRILHTITGMKEELKSHLVNLQGLEFIYEKSLFPELEYIFKHALIQEVAYNSLLIKRRREIHERIGKAIEEVYADRLEEFYEMLAYHYLMAENWEKAFQYLRLSAEKAHRSYSTHEAFRYYREALKALGRLPDTEQNKRARVDITVPMVTVMVALNYPEGCLSILEEALSAAEGLGDRPASLQLYSLVGTVHSWAGNNVEALKFIQKAFDEAENLGDEFTALQTAVNLCNVYFNSGEAARLVDVATRAIALMEQTRVASLGPAPEFDMYMMLLDFLGWARSMLGDFDEGERLCGKAISVATEIHSQYSLAMAHVLWAVASTYRGRAESVLVHASEAKGICEKAQIDVFLGTCWMLEGYGHYYQDDFAIARECAGKSITLALEHRLVMVASPAYVLSGLVSQALGNLPEARRSMEQALKVARDNNQKHFEGQARICLARLTIEEDASQVGAAEQTVLEGLEIVEDLQIRPLQAWGHLDLGETYAIAGQKKRALASLKKARQMCQEMGMDYYLARTEKALEKLQG
jgi:predicted ATPase/class 3 adenylate cyclase